MPKGGARKGAGRPRGQGKYGEATKAIRVPESKVKYISEIVSKGLYEIPLYGDRVAAGFPSPADDYLEDKIDLNQYLVKHPASTFLVRASGNSMINAVIKLFHGKGETDDATYIYSEKDNALFTGDFFIWSLPNAGNPSKSQRYVGSWGEVLKKMSELNPEYLFPGHGPLIKGKKEITKVLLDTSNCMLWIEDNVLSLMNSGHSLREIHSKLSLPPEFQQPYLVSVYDDFKFLINSVWRQYGGWYSGTPSELIPPALDEIGKTYIDMAGGEDNLLEFLNSLVSSEKYREASVIVDAVYTINKDLFSEIKNEIYLNLSEQETSLMAKGIYKFDLDS